ncbi:hypothetical protein GLW08_00810 [Pontibacillus yanchengensis]|uniref:Uncharacterized protein n=1 Tax=Pontibacillus yanchengensis TaxID=462910 RepID=A0ACC7V9R1_9BACI|nr:hypothetical protein [Pontibacillus yanchengensis]MYL51868.1 hypothetical protein [Pontibacillus yanchengensis]
MTNSRPNNLLGRPIDEILSSSELLDAYRAQIKQDFEIEIKNDQQDFYTVQIIPIFNNQNQPSGVLSIFSNITDRKNMNGNYIKKQLQMILPVYFIENISLVMRPNI